MFVREKATSAKKRRFLGDYLNSEILAFFGFDETNVTERFGNDGDSDYIWESSHPELDGQVVILQNWDLGRSRFFIRYIPMSDEYIIPDHFSEFFEKVCETRSTQYRVPICELVDVLEETTGLELPDHLRP